VPESKVQNDVVEVPEDAAAIGHLMAFISASGWPLELLAAASGEGASAAQGDRLLPLMYRP
jgi:hypothetical protein